MLIRNTTFSLKGITKKRMNLFLVNYLQKSALIINFIDKGFNFLNNGNLNFLK